MKQMYSYDSHRIWLDAESTAAIRELQAQYRDLGIPPGRLTPSALLRRAVITHREVVSELLASQPADSLEVTREKDRMWSCTTRKGTLGDTK
jgi:hypothetical protein